MPNTYDKIEVKRQGDRYCLVADGIHRGFTNDEGVAALLGDSRVEPDPRTPEGAFLTENHYAAEAARLLARAIEKRSDHVLLRAETFATLAVAFEQRQTRFDLLGIARGEL